MGKSNIASTFGIALSEALAALPKPPEPEPGTKFISAAQLQSFLSSEHASMTRAIADDVLAVVAEIQRWRESEPGADHFFRQHGIVTRVRKVRA
jgi:hypothetical protein